MSRPRAVVITHGRRSAYLEPVSASVRAAVGRSGSPSMYDSRRKRLSVPIQYAGQVQRELSRAGLRFVFDREGAA